MRAHPKKRIGFITQAGADYYLGRSEMVAGYHYKYGNYLYFDALAGAIYNPSRKSNISFTAGPSIGIYKKHGEFGFALNCEGSYYFTGKFAITPAIVYMKAHETDALWAGSLQLTLAF
jgi:hypothetical protein